MDLHTSFEAIVSQMLADYREGRHRPDLAGEERALHVWESYRPRMDRSVVAAFEKRGDGDAVLGWHAVLADHGESI